LLELANNIKFSDELELLKHDILIFEEKKEQDFRIAKFLVAKNKILTTYDNEELYFYDGTYYTPQGEAKLKEQIQYVLGADARNNRIVEIIGHVKRSTFIDRKIFQANARRYICLKNGVYDLSEKTLISHSPELYLNTKINLNLCKDAISPNIDKFIRETFPEDKQFLAYEIIAYALYCDVPIQKAFMLLGEGRNGKSTFLKLLRGFLGIENCAGMELQEIEEGRFSLAELYNKRVNIFGDISSKALQRTGRFKSLTGGDLVQAEKKFKDSFSYQPFAKLIFSCNQLPKSPDDTDAFYRRWLLIDFPNRFDDTNADKRLIEKLITDPELEGLLNKAIPVLHNLLDRGVFSFNPSIEEIREIYIRLSDPVASFMMDCLEQDGETVIVKQTLYRLFCEYCKVGHYPIPSENSFSRALIQEGKVIDYYRRDGSQRLKCWKGYKYIGELVPEQELMINYKPD